MNIYFYEMKSQLKSYITWTVSILLFFFIFMSGMYSVFMDSNDAVQKMLAGLPAGFAAAFGVVLEQLFTYGGFYSFIYTYIGLVGAIMASSIALAAFSREKRSKCTDFLLTKPVSRAAVFISKLLSCLTLLLAVNILYVALAAIAYLSAGQDQAQLGRFIWAACGLFFMQLVFMSFGIIFAVFARKVRSISGLATAFGFAGFILSALHGLLEEDSIRFIAPLKYFEPMSVFSSGGYELKYAVTAAVVVIVCVGMSYIRFRHSDTPAI